MSYGFSNSESTSKTLISLRHFAELRGLGRAYRKTSTYTKQHNTKIRQAATYRQGFEPTIPVIGWSKTVHVSGYVATAVEQ
jgi:hypothetical protein